MTRVRPGSYLTGARLEGRSHPFMCFAGRQIEDVELTFAPGLALPAIPPGRRIESSHFSYLSQYRLDGRTLKVRREFISKVAGQVCPPEAELEVAGVLAGVVADLNARIRMSAASAVRIAVKQQPGATGQQPSKASGGSQSARNVQHGAQIQAE
jgi:hypothetical protein